MKSNNASSEKIQTSIHPRIRLQYGPKHFGDARDNPDYKGQRSTMPRRQR